MIYIQHSDNREIHTSTSTSPFETCFGYFPPSPLDVVYGKQGEVREDLTGYALKTFTFLEDQADPFASIRDIEEVT